MNKKLVTVILVHYIKKDRDIIMEKIKRVIILVLDGVGAGEAPDAAAYSDVGSNSLGNVARAIRQNSRLGYESGLIWRIAVLRQRVRIVLEREPLQPDMFDKLL